MSGNTKPVGVAYADPAQDAVYLPVSGLKIGTAGAEVAVDTTAAELNKLAGVTAGTAAASKAAVLGASKNLDVLGLPVGGLKIGAAASEVATTMSAAELNSLTDVVASVTTTATPASGTCGVQFVFKNAAGNAIGSARRMQMYMSDANGIPATAATGLAVLTNGSYDVLVANKIAMVNTTAAGLLGITVTNGAGTYYLSFVLPNGKIITSSALTVN